ncbi:bifunctional RNase H/acid phosphatase [Streptomyces ipomoeae]|uniref:Bifunctional RNase H/acid phosphatase n=1 Tax=Streptomyces ipomoeae TaxID=103232 RepID=A0AAE8VSJ2_9ACTN|nr:bifunctional RNase H/acid phosphatase [Streptomyces ipomoeae]MDX2878346.1 bifunctional RNase H/acid phosphatase [Streptomyces ipomoeae]TQE15442.1 bifunctional RNase H/acid phosphatase [Streptomyces ipomoeae]
MREFIVEADGGSRGNPGPAGYGSVVRDAATGETLAEAAEYIGVATNNVAEYRGLIAGLKAARALDPTATVRVRMDSKLVVEQMSGRWKIKHPDMKPLAAEAARILPPDHVTYEWIPRDQNKHADRLANEAMDAGKRGERWSQSTSTADLDTRAPAAASPAPEASGPPGDAAAGAAKIRAALAKARDEAATGGPVGVASSGSAGAPAVPAAAPGESGGPVGVASSGSAGTAVSAAVPGEPGAGRPAGANSPISGSSPAASAAAPGESGGPVGVASSGSVGSPAAPDAAPGESGAGSRTGAKPPSPVRTPAAPVVAARDTVSVPAPVASRGATSSSASAAGSAKAAADIRAARNIASTAPDLGTPATFVLLRHGETPLTPQKRFSGSGGSDPSLSEGGRYQAERVAVALAARGTIQEILSSPLTRCRETAGIVAARLGLSVKVEDGLRETDFGAWEGLTFGEVRERYPEDMNAWLASPDAAPTGGGESFAAVAARVAATRDELVAAYRGRTVLLVTHVTPIKTLVRLALGAPPESLFRMELSAASLSALAYYADGNATLRLLNDTSHLR